MFSVTLVGLRRGTGPRGAITRDLPGEALGTSLPGHSYYLIHIHRAVKENSSFKSSILQYRFP